VPGLVVAGGQSPGDDEHLTNVCGAFIGVADRALQLTVEFVIVEEQPHRGLVELA
jgi:hypothetical protein